MRNGICHFSFFIAKSEQIAPTHLGISFDLSLRRESVLRVSCKSGIQFEMDHNHWVAFKIHLIAFPCRANFETELTFYKAVIFETGVSFEDGSWGELESVLR